MFNLDKFIYEKIVKRPHSMFEEDIEDNKEELSKKIKGKSVLVIGGAGSIGSSFVKAILPFKPTTLVVVDTNENALAELTRDIRSTKGMYIPEDYIPYPMDYNSVVFRKMFCKRRGFDIIGNFSAHKHVRSEKDIYSIEALLRNNVLYAKKLLDLLVKYPPEEYFCVSTDKAANPVNIMGASKRLMEDLIFTYSDKFPIKTARFANVAFSNGSLPAGYLARISKLQPISAPMDVKRYFVSPEESGQICMLACMLGKNREIFFPKLKETQMMTFDKIASEIIQEQGFKVLYCESDAEAIDKSVDLKKGGKMYPVYYSQSDTSGEKDYEEFFTEQESVDNDRLKALGIIINKTIPDKGSLFNMMEELEKLFECEDLSKDKIVKLIGEYLPNFEHLEKGKTLDSKM